MSKNLTRKGLALGAIVALGSSLFAGTAAHAADEVTLAPSAGTLYKTVEGEQFTFLAGLAPAVPAGNIVQLKLQTVTTATIAVKADGTDGKTTAATDAGGTQPTNTKVYRQTAAPTVGTPNYFGVTVTSAIAAGTPATVALTAFLDSNNNNVLDAGEYVSATRTVTFVDAADLVATTTLTQPSEGDTTVKATVVLDGINQEQVSNTHLAVYFTKGDGTALAGSTNAQTSGAGAFSGDNLVVPAALASGSYTATSATITALGATGFVKAATYYLATATAASSHLSGNSKAAPADLLGTAVGSNVKSITARTVNRIVLSADATANNLASTVNTDGVASTATTGAASIDARLNTAITVKAVIKDAATTPAVVSGASVKAVVAAAGLTATAPAKTISVNGTVYSDSAATGLTGGVTLTSDASGVVSVAIVPVGFAANSTFTVTFTVQGITAVTTVTQKAETYSLVVDKAISASTNRSVTSGSAISEGYTLVDQFKQVASTGNYRLKVTTANTTGTPLSSTGATYFGFTAGKATVAYTPAAAGVFSVTHTDLEKQNTTSSNWEASTTWNSGQFTMPTALTVTSVAAQTDVVTATSSSSTTAVAVADAAEKAIDTRLAAGSVATYAGGEATTISGTVSNSLNGVLRSGAAVTVSSPGLLFSTTNAGTVFTADSITVFADNNGAYSVVAISNVAGSFTVTVTSGAATKTATAKFASTLAPAKVAVKVADGAAQFQSGRALDVTFSVSDKYGNAVATPSLTGYVADTGKLTIAQTGSGYLAVTGDVVATAGTYTTKLITNAGDLGTSTITATLDLATDVAATATSEFGITDVTDISSAGKAIYVNTEFAKGKVVTVYINGVRMPVKAAEATDNAVERKYTQRKAGTYTVTVRVSGGVVASEKIVIK